MPFDEVAAEWIGLDPEKASSLIDARLQLHWLSQALSAVGEAHVSHEPDFSHTSMQWLPSLGLARPCCNGERIVALGMRESVTLSVLPTGGDEEESGRALLMDGRTLDEAVAWLSETLTENGHPGELKLPDYEMPKHPFASGERFDADQEMVEELYLWYAHAAAMQKAVAENTLGASPVRCWPHHFDIATLVSLELEAGDPEHSRSIGFGMSPGDATYDQPYFYLNPWPPQRLKDKELPPLAGNGIWHTEGFTGAVLPGSKLTKDARQQGQQVLEFVRSAMAGGRVLLDTL